MADGDAAGLPADPAERAIAIAEKIADTQDAIVKHQDAIVKQQGKTRRNQRWLAAGWLLDIALSALAAFLILGLVHVIAEVHRSQLQACQIGNSFRAGQLALWDHVIAVSKPPPHETAAQRQARLATVTAFRGYIAKQFRPVNCSRLYP